MVGAIGQVPVTAGRLDSRLRGKDDMWPRLSVGQQAGGWPHRPGTREI